MPGAHCSRTHPWLLWLPTPSQRGSHSAKTGLGVLTVRWQLTRAASDRHECDLCTAQFVRLSIVI